MIICELRYFPFFRMSCRLRQTRFFPRPCNVRSLRLTTYDYSRPNDVLCMRDKYDCPRAVIALYRRYKPRHIYTTSEKRYLFKHVYYIHINALVICRPYRKCEKPLSALAMDGGKGHKCLWHQLNFPISRTRHTLISGVTYFRPPPPNDTLVTTYVGGGGARLLLNRTLEIYNSWTKYSQPPYEWNINTQTRGRFIFSSELYKCIKTISFWSACDICGKRTFLYRGP